MKRSSRLQAIALSMMIFCIGSDGSESQGGQQAPTAPGSTFTVQAGQKFILQLETALHTRTTRKGDRAEFSTAADIVVDKQVIIPSKSWIRATVTKAKRAGRIAGRAEVQLRFDEIRLADGTVVPLHATITRVGYDPVDPAKEGDPSVKGESGAGGDVGTVAKAGAQGAIIGVLTAGARGALYGGAAGVAVTAVGMMLRRGPDLDLPRDTMFEARFDQPLSVPSAAIQPTSPLPVQIQDTPAAPQTVMASAANPSSPPRPVLSRADTAGRPPVEKPPAIKPPETPPPATTAPPVAQPVEPQPASEGGLKLRVNVRMVLVDAVVKDRGGRLMENLTRNDFQIYEDGVKQELQSFSRDELPLAVALVIDRSGSVGPYISELRRIAERTLRELKPDDEVALFSFAADVQRHVDLTTDRRRISDGIDRIRAGGGTDIIDALHESAVYLKQSAPDRRHAIILISDNQNTVGSKTSEAETIRVAIESETVVYSLKTAGQGRAMALQLPTLVLGHDPVGKVTQETGGEIIKVTNVSSFGAAMGAVISHLRLRYSIGYYAPNPSQGAFHSIVVRLDDHLGKPGSDYFIHARRGYYATADQNR